MEIATMTGTRQPRVLILPHVAVQGGAGLYNQAAIKAIASEATVTLIGNFASAYSGLGCQIVAARLPSRPVLPAYSGASLWAFFFYALLAPIHFIGMLIWAKRQLSLLAEYDAIIVTSSIDLLTLRAIGMVCPELKLICLVQENAFLTCIRGAVNRSLLMKIDRVVSISRSWSARAAEYGINSIIAVNPFDAPAPQITTDSDDADATIDFLFMGGGERIKGIDLFLPLLERLALQRPVHAILLGTISAEKVKYITAIQERLAARGSSLTLQGFVTNVNPFLRDARLLLLPITDPHFCRPAIEAGFCNRTFIVSSLPDIDDFALPGENCATAVPGDIEDWAATCERLLDDNKERHRLAEANRQRSLTLFSSAAFTVAYRQVIEACR